MSSGFGTSGHWDTGIKLREWDIGTLIEGGWDEVIVAFVTFVTLVTEIFHGKFLEQWGKLGHWDGWDIGTLVIRMA